AATFHERRRSARVGRSLRRLVQRRASSQRDSLRNAERPPLRSPGTHPRASPRPLRTRTREETRSVVWPHARLDARWARCPEPRTSTPRRRGVTLATTTLTPTAQLVEITPSRSPR